MKNQNTPTITPIHNLTWYQVLVYKLFFKVFDPILRNRLDIVLLFKRHIDGYVCKQFNGVKLLDQEQTTFDIEEDSIRK